MIMLVFVTIGIQALKGLGENLFRMWLNVVDRAFLVCYNSFMHSNYVFDQSTYVIMDVVNKFNMGNDEQELTRVDFAHFFKALEKERLLAKDISREDFLKHLIGECRVEHWGSEGLLDRFDVEDISTSLEKAGFLDTE